MSTDGRGIGSGLAGLFACLALNFIAVAIFFVGIGGFGWSKLATVALGAVLGIGISQLLYVIPVVIWARRRGKRSFASGMIIGAAITFLLNGACCGWFLIAKPRIGG